MNFIKKYFFYQVPKDEKKSIRQKIISEDHKGYIIILFCIFAFQMIMLLRSYLSYGFECLDKPWVHAYRLLYLGLGFICLLAVMFVKIAVKKKMDFFYFVVVSLMMVSLQLWSAGIVILDSHNGADLTTFSYVSIAIAGFMILEPWIASINMTSVTILLNILFVIKFNSYNSGLFINSLSILVLSVLLSTFNFYRRIKKLTLEKENEKLAKLLEQKTIIDDLTKLYNRRYLTNNLEQNLITGTKPSSVMMMDLDFFKIINDKYGHVAGDEVLRKVGEVVLDFIKDDGYAVRYGGEEFMLFYNSIDNDELYSKAQELRKMFENVEVRTNDEQIIRFTVSIGTAFATENLTYTSMISLADEALYEAKKTRNCCAKSKQ